MSQQACENLDGQCGASWCNCDEARKRATPSKAEAAARWKETQRLLNDALRAVNDLSNHCRDVADEARMYLANQALHKLWEIK